MHLGEAASHLLVAALHRSSVVNTSQVKRVIPYPGGQSDRARIVPALILSDVGRWIS